MENLPEAVFIDRDGVINEEVKDLDKVEKLKLIQGSAEGIRRLNEHSIKVIIITNQPGIAKGFYSFETLAQIHKKLKTLLKTHNARIDDIFVCPHHPERGFKGEVAELKINCNCRKPKTGLFIAAKKKYDLNLSNCFMIGDRTVDIKAGHDSGCKTILVKTGYRGEDKKHIIRPDYVCKDLLEASKLVLGEK